ncbi:MAG: hypothetical protein JJ863_32390 [Deltaproteobacteria bacterium]|nr:hypothetical protein [Deltaproteobacteria bacterium]
MRAEAIHRMGPEGWLDLLEGGHPVPENVLAGNEFRGVSLGLPTVLEKLTWKKFRKAFHRDERTGALRGWNVRLEQDGLDAPDRPKQKRGEPFTFGHFAVVPLAGYAPAGYRGRQVRVPAGRMLDYGKGDNGLDPIRFLRDPIVAVREGDGSLLFGWSYLDLGLRRVATPSFFTLELAGPVTHVPSR